MSRSSWGLGISTFALDVLCAVFFAGNVAFFVAYPDYWWNAAAAAFQLYLLIAGLER